MVKPTPTKGLSTTRKDSANNKSNYSEKGPPNLDFRSLRFRLERVFGEGMSSEKHFSLPERQKYFPASSPPTTLPTPLFWQLLDRLGPSRSGPISRGAMGPRCFFHLGFSCSLA